MNRLGKLKCMNEIMRMCGERERDWEVGVLLLLLV